LGGTKQASLDQLAERPERVGLVPAAHSPARRSPPDVPGARVD